MNFHIVTLFPEVVEPYVRSSILGRALRDGKISVSFYDPKDFTLDPRIRIDDRPYGGGPGMVIQALPVLRAVDAARGRKRKVKIVITGPAGKQFTSRDAKEWSEGYKDIIIICGRYEGIDARVKEALGAEEISIGPYVLSGGEIPAMVMTDAVARHIPGVLGNLDSIEENRVAASDAYTRPEILEYKKKKYSVPKVLLSGHHKNIDQWRGKRGSISKQTDSETIQNQSENK